MQRARAAYLGYQIFILIVRALVDDLQFATKVKTTYVTPHWRATHLHLIKRSNIFEQTDLSNRLFVPLRSLFKALFKKTMSRYMFMDIHASLPIYSEYEAEIASLDHYSIVERVYSISSVKRPKWQFLMVWAHLMKIMRDLMDALKCVRLWSQSP